ncbi:MAG: hypothetical protein B7Z26_04940, partial [Asticcacaulis sp. 32-58-5]
CAIWTAWNGVAATDYVFSVVQGEAYYRASGMTDLQIAYFSSLPLWAAGMWTVSVWAGVLSVIGLLLRRRLAGVMILAVVVGTIGYCIYVYAMSAGMAAMGGLWFMPALMVAVMILLARYVRDMAARKVIC